MGGDTVRTLQHLLERKAFPGYDTDASWVRSLTCVSTPLNGSTSSQDVAHRFCVAVATPSNAAPYLRLTSTRTLDVLADTAL